jgi:anti-anti-sigma regulatory factor
MPCPTRSFGAVGRRSFPLPGRPAIRPRSPLAPAVLIFPPAGGGRLLTVSRQPGAARGRFGGVPLGSKTISLQISPVRPPGEAGELRARGPETPSGPPGARSSPPGTGSPRPGQRIRHAVPPLPEGAADMPDQQTCASPVIVTLPARLDAAAAEQAADRITAAFIPGVRVVIADLTAAARCDRSAIRNLLRAHRKAAARWGRCASRSVRTARCTRSPASPARIRCWRSIPPSSTPRPAGHRHQPATARLPGGHDRGCCV